MGRLNSLNKFCAECGEGALSSQLAQLRNCVRFFWKARLLFEAGELSSVSKTAKYSLKLKRRVAATRPAR